MKLNSPTFLKAAALSGVVLAGAMAPSLASAQSWYGYGYGGGWHEVTRCDRDGDRCATFRCDRDGDRCSRISGWRHVNRYGYRRDGYGDGYGYGHTVTRCDRDGDRCWRERY
jgi:hypothetical protein